jgi:hypothetical protein
MKIKTLPDVLELNFIASHTLICGHKPSKLTLQELEDGVSKFQSEESILKFGLFGGDLAVQPFNPAVTAEDWVPKEGEFIYPTYRLLSETLVYKWGIPIDFSMNNILKKSISKFLGQTVNTNHVTEVENAIGSIVEVAWQDSYKVGKITVPAGANGVFKIDAKSNPRIARGILMDPPAIHSTSTTVRFKHVQSHPQMSREEFFDKAGSYDDKGELIRLIVTDVVGYKEQSLVGRGADPFAQKVNKDGKIQDPEYAASAYKMSMDDESFDFKDILEIKNSFNNTQITFKTDNDMEFGEMLTALGLSAESFKDIAELKAHVEKLQLDSTALQALTAVKGDLTPEVLTSLMDTATKVPSAEDTQLLTDVKALGTLDDIKAGIASGNTHLTAVRLEAVNHYKLVYGEKADANIIATIENANLATAESFANTYKAELESKAPLHCVKCGSKEITREATQKADPDKTLSFEEQKEAIRKSKKTVKA